METRAARFEALRHQWRLRDWSPPRQSCRQAPGLAVRRQEEAVVAAAQQAGVAHPLHLTALLQPPLAARFLISCCRKDRIRQAAAEASD